MLFLCHLLLGGTGKRIHMPTMIRSNAKATDIRNNLIGTPGNELKQNKRRKKKKSAVVIDQNSSLLR